MIEVFDRKEFYFTSENKFLSEKNTTNKGESFQMLIYAPTCEGVVTQNC